MAVMYVALVEPDLLHRKSVYVDVCSSSADIRAYILLRFPVVETRILIIIYFSLGDLYTFLKY